MTMKNTYTFSPESKSYLFKGLILGIVIFVIGLISSLNGDVPLKILIVSNLYTVALYALWIGITALFFLSACTLALGAWHVQIQKVILSIAGVIPYAIGLMAVIFLFFSKDLFMWMHSDVFDLESANYDALVATKEAYLNPVRFWVTTVILFAVTYVLNHVWNKNINSMDDNPSILIFDKSRAIAAVTIVIVAMGVNTFGTWDWAMSIQPHWYSTMYSWYLMASAAVGMLSILFILLAYLKKNDYLPNVNENHRHDVSKYIFAISVFWTYVWFAQFMLIWYANIPEETLYFSIRIGSYPVMFYLALVINFILPFLVLMKRNSKRMVVPGLVISALLIIGHWMDFFSMIVPQLLPNGGGMGLISVGLFVIIASAYGYITLTTLSKYKDLESSTHPYYKESYNHQI